MKYLGKAKIEFMGQLMEIKLTRIDLKAKGFAGVIDLGGKPYELRNKGGNGLSLASLTDIELNFSK